MRLARQSHLQFGFECQTAALIWIQLRDLAACFHVRGLCHSIRPPLRGRAERRVPAAPAAPCAKVKSTRVSSPRSHRNHPAFRTQWASGLLRALPGERLDACHRRSPTGLCPPSVEDELRRARCPSGTRTARLGPAQTAWFVSASSMTHGPSSKGDPPCHLLRA